VSKEKDCIIKIGYFEPGAKTGSVEIVNVTTNKTLKTFTESRSDHFSSNCNTTTMERVLIKLRQFNIFK